MCMMGKAEGSRCFFIIVTKGGSGGIAIVAYQNDLVAVRFKGVQTEANCRGL